MCSRSPHCAENRPPITTPDGISQMPEPRLYWDDFTPGSVIECGPRLVTREEIVAFAAEFDPQPMHLDEAAGSAGMLGGLSASGWHSCCLLMRLITDGFIGQTHFLGSGGVEEVCWRAPLRPGDTVTVRVMVIETRASRSRPGIGLVKFRMEMRNATAAEPLMTLVVSPMFARRDAASTPARQPA
jgi:acyl dehydratase